MGQFARGCRAVVACVGGRCEVAQHKHGVGVVIQTVVLLCGGIVIIRCREAPQQVVEGLHVGVRGHNVGHVVGRGHHAFHLMYITVLAGDVAIHDFLSVHPRVADRVRLAIGECCQVAVGNFVVLHVGGQEVDHGLRRVVAKQHDAVLVILVLLPVGGVGHLVGIDACHRVEHRHGRLTAHAHALLGWVAANVAQQLDEVGVVDHRGVEDKLLLGLREVLILLHSPTVGLEPLVEGIVVGSKQGLTTSLAEHGGLSEVVDESQRVRVVALFLELVIDGVAQP